VLGHLGRQALHLRPRRLLLVVAHGRRPPTSYSFYLCK
jgi:hypothetical protein